MPLAIALGVLAGYFKGWIDDVIQYFYTVLSAIPPILLVAAFVLLINVYIDKNAESFATGVERAEFRLFLLCVILGITGWATLCRLLRAETLKISELEYVQAAHAFGVSHGRIMWRHILPNVMHLVLIVAVLDFSALVLYEAVLSYVGVGVDPNSSSFGSMINLARSEMSRDPAVWWNLATAFTFMLALVLAANLFADAVREAFDPRSRAFRPRRFRLKEATVSGEGPMSEAVLVIEALDTVLDTDSGLVHAVDALSLTLTRGETFALVGESGCGKSMTALSILRLLPDNGRVQGGRMDLSGTDIAQLPEARMRDVRGRRVSIIFQEPSTSLNPVLPVGRQIVEVIERHTALRGAAARAKALDWLGASGCPNPNVASTAIRFSCRAARSSA